MHEELWQEYSQDRSIALRNQLVSGNLNLVRKIVATKFSGFVDDEEDLFQIGCIGLIKAIERFDPALKYKFSSYAYTSIAGEILHYLRDKKEAIRYPRKMPRRRVQSLNNVWVWTEGERIEFLDMLIDDRDLERLEVLTAVPEIENENQRQVIDLHYSQELHQKKIAEILGVSNVTVGRWLQKGIASLQQILEVPSAT